MRTLAMTLAYDGAGFSGSQVQPGRRTVQGELEAAWRRLTGEAVRCSLAGRTDAGAHARGQVAGVETRSSIRGEDLPGALAAVLPADLRIVDAREERSGFDARRDARWRRYEYAWPRVGPMVWADVQRMRASGDYLLGERDFRAYASTGEYGPRGFVRRLLRLDVHHDRDAVTAVVVADAFLRQMVRRIAAALACVGTGRMAEFDPARALAVGDRSVLPSPAPARFLTLVAVGYGEYTE